METTDNPPIRISCPRVKRQPETKTGEDAPDPESKKNIFLEAVNLMENRITEYLNGDREQPELPIREPAPAEAPGLFGRLRGRGKGNTKA
jgi:hypothetical protein